MHGLSTGFTIHALREQKSKPLLANYLLPKCVPESQKYYEKKRAEGDKTEWR